MEDGIQAALIWDEGDTLAIPPDPPAAATSGQSLNMVETA
jgi:hypothetical protein